MHRNYTILTTKWGGTLIELIVVKLRKLMNLGKISLTSLNSLISLTVLRSKAQRTDRNISPPHRRGWVELPGLTAQVPPSWVAANICRLKVVEVVLCTAET